MERRYANGNHVPLRGVKAELGYSAVKTKTRENVVLVHDGLARSPNWCGAFCVIEIDLGCGLARVFFAELKTGVSGTPDN